VFLHKFTMKWFDHNICLNILVSRKSSCPYVVICHIDLIKNIKFHPTSKHVSVKFHCIKEAMELGEVILLKVKAENN
jgi:hypothetical protein